MTDEAHGYAICVRPSARKAIQEAYDRLADFPGSEIANRWYEGLQDLFAELASFPGRYAPVRESRLFRADVHVALHSLSSRGAVHRVLFTIEEAADDCPYPQRPPRVPQADDAEGGAGA